MEFLGDAYILGIVIYLAKGHGIFQDILFRKMPEFAKYKYNIYF
jgi:Metallo-peptidase family M12B Reprolysin-like